MTLMTFAFRLITLSRSTSLMSTLLLLMATVSFLVLIEIRLMRLLLLV